MSYQILGRAVRNEFLALGTIFSAVAIGYAATSGGSKEKTPAKSGGSIQETIKKAKEAVPLGAKSSEEEQLMDSIKKFIEEEESKLKH